MRDLFNTVLTAHAFAGSAVKATAQGPAVNVTSADGVLFVADVETLGDTLSGTVYYEFRVQESQDGSTGWADAATQYVQYAPVLLNSGTLGDAAQTIKVGYLGYAPYVRLEVIVNGTMTNGTNVNAVAILGFLRHGTTVPQVP